MPSLKGNRWAAKLGVLKDESSALAMFNQKILKFPGNISLKRLHGSKLVEYSIKNYSTNHLLWKIWSAKIGFIQSHLERMIFSDVLWDPNVHSHLLDASAVLVELNSARSTPRT